MLILLSMVALKPTNNRFWQMRSLWLMTIVVIQSLSLLLVLRKNHERFPTIYWLPNIQKRPYKARFIGNFSSCTTTEINDIMLYCHQNSFNQVFRKKFMKHQVKSVLDYKTSGEVLNKLKSREFRATSLLPYDFPHFILHYPII